MRARRWSRSYRCSGHIEEESFSLDSKTIAMLLPQGVPEEVLGEVVE